MNARIRFNFAHLCAVGNCTTKRWSASRRDVLKKLHRPPIPRMSQSITRRKPRPSLQRRSKRGASANQPQLLSNVRTCNFCGDANLQMASILPRKWSPTWSNVFSHESTGLISQSPSRKCLSKWQLQTVTLRSQRQTLSRKSSCTSVTMSLLTHSAWPSTTRSSRSLANPWLGHLPKKS